MATKNELQGDMSAATFLADTPTWLLGAGSAVLIIGFGDTKYMVIFIRTL